MSEEFEEIGPDKVRSSRGFTVQVFPPGCIDYTDAAGTIRIDTELHVRPLVLHVYRKSKDLKEQPSARVYEILENTLVALKYLGHSAKLE